MKVGGVTILFTFDIPIFVGAIGMALWIESDVAKGEELRGRLRGDIWMIHWNTCIKYIFILCRRWLKCIQYTIESPSPHDSHTQFYRFT